MTRTEKLRRAFTRLEGSVAAAIVALDDGTPERIELIHELAGNLGLISGEILLAERDERNKLAMRGESE